jgi:cyclase
VKRVQPISKILLLTAVFLLASFSATPPAYSDGSVQKLAANLYAYISDNDGSSNSTFLVGPHEIIVVDTGLNSAEGEKLNRAIRSVSDRTVRYILNTHYHPDHQGGNAVVGPNAVIMSTPFTRTRTLEMIASAKKKGSSAPGTSSFKPANLTFTSKITLYAGSDPVELYALGAAHTGGDAIAYFPNEHVIATGDVYITRSCPAIDDGDVRHWIQVLDFMLSLDATRFVPGHFEVASRAQVQRFRDYLTDLYAQVETMYKSGATLEQVRHGIHMEKYADFRQFPKFRATFADNAAEVYRELASAGLQNTSPK